MNKQNHQFVISVPALIISVLIFLNIFLFFPKGAETQSIFTIKSDVSMDSTGGNNQRKLARTSNGDFHVVYHRSDGIYQQIYYSKSTDGGETWTETQLTSGDYSQNRPSIAVDSHDYLHVVWWGKHSESPTKEQIRYIKYTDSWSDITNLTSGDYDQNQSSLSIDSHDYLHVLWNGKYADSSSYYQIRYIKYTDSWSDITNLTSGDYSQNRPSIAVDSHDYLHVVWWGKHSESPTKEQIRYIKYTDSWSDITNLTSGDYSQNYPFIAVDSRDYLHVVWRGLHATASNTYQIRYIKYADSWGSIEDLTNEDSSRNQWNAVIGVDSHDYIHVAWNGRHASSTTAYEIRYIKYADSWGSIEDLTGSLLVIDQHPNLIWFLHPTNKGAKTNRPKDGYAFIWTAGTTLNFYKSSDLDWEEEDATGPDDFTLSSPVNNSRTSNKKPTLSWNASSDSESGLAKYRLYINGILDRDDIDINDASTIPINVLSCGSNTWFIRAYDNAGNYTDSPTYNLIRVCGGGTPRALYDVNFTAIPSGGGTVPQGGSYYEGTIITITATPEPGYIFLFWEEQGIEISRDPNYTFIINSDRGVIARFQEESLLEEKPEPEKPITEMSSLEINVKILQIQQQIIELIKQLIQLIQEQITQLKTQLP